jgi:hypothetical protein
MLGKMSYLKKIFPYTCSFGRLTLHTSFGKSTELTQQIYKLVGERNTPNQRIKAKISSNSNVLFLKSSTLESWKSKIRLTLGIQRSLNNGGGYDWPLEEFLNTVHAKISIFLPPLY